ncbi:glutaminyl-peptide cyclotransferase [Nocardia mangyaensis]|uniref:glutaminyl-peptide cyclotransferase n=1 Tax=Nocardia mangyaensis TaxID=2213200 RepID=UPI002674CB8A|nr:glutaminyl-peptide cyclotransferase [Nocardia mangyaensis]MDO3650358.1 glutaminyl-peptide cyclotransferase [Nocardia mangyaensis]
MNRIGTSLAVAVLVSLLAATACGAAEEPGPPRWRVEVIGSSPHDPQAFTQGLEVVDGIRYESTGMWGVSSARATDQDTGVERARADLPAEMFGEGMTRAGDVVWQITWKDGIAFARDPETLAETGRVTYEGEGWGLCAQPDRLVMSDGTDTLTFRDRVTFAKTGSVTLSGHSRLQPNELDCAPDGTVYANNYPSDEILRVDPDTGRVLAVIEAGGLLSPAERAGTDVLNGIAHLPGTDRFLLTGKYWPRLFEVRFVPK